MITRLSVKGGTKMLHKTRSKTLPLILITSLLSIGVWAQRQPVDTSGVPVLQPRGGLQSGIQKITPTTATRGAFGEDNDTNELRGCVKPKGKFLFNFDNGKLSDMLAQISQLTCKSFIIASDSGLSSKTITVLSRSAIDGDEAWKVFLSALAVNQIGLSQSGKYYKVVNQANTNKTPLPTFGRDDVIPDDEGIVTMLYDAKSISAQSALNFIRAFSMDRAPQLVGESHVVFSDTGANVRRILKILEKADAGGGKTQIYILDLKYSNPQDMAGKLSELFSSGQSTPSFSRPATQFRRPGQFQQGSQGQSTGYQKIIADERTNRLIVIASESAYAKIKEIVEELDIENSNTSSQKQIFVYHLENSDAEKMSTTLTTLLSGVTPQAQGQGPNVRPQVFAPVSENVLFEDQVKVTADKPNNALVIVATPRDYKALSKVVRKLDKERLQVYIEAAIFDIEISDDKALGFEIYSGLQVPVPGLAAGGLGLLANAGGQALATGVFESVKPGIAAQSPNAGALAIPNFIGTFGLMGLGTVPLPGGGTAQIPSVGFLLKALQKTSNIEVLSTPSVMSLDNEEASLEVGKKVPRLSGLTNVGSGGTAGLGSLQQSVVYEDATLKFKVTPHVNAGEKIQLVIDQDISDIGNPRQVAGQTSFDITKKLAKTTVVAKDQETVVLGGLISESTSLTEQKTPILGDIPLLGNLFKTTTKTKTKKNLVLVLTPHIVRSPEDMKKILDRKMKEREDLANLYFGDQITKFNPQVNFDKKQGPIAQLLREVETEMQRFENGGSGLPGELLITPSEKKESVERKERKIDFVVPASDEPGDDNYYYEPQFMAPPNLRTGVGQPDVVEPMPNELVQPLPENVPATPVPQNNFPQNDGNVQPEGANVVPNTVPVTPQ